MTLVAVAMLVSIWLALTRTRIGLVIQAALSHPQTVEALGHNVPRVFMLVFGGGAALAGLAGVIGGNAFVTEPGMAAAVGPIIFVTVVVGGMGSLAGAFVARRNIRSGRGDPRGARRIAAWVFICRMLFWIFAAHHTRLFVAEFAIFSLAFAKSLIIRYSG